MWSSDDIQVRVIPPGHDHTDPLSFTYSIYILLKRPDGINIWRDGVWYPVPEGAAVEPSARFTPELVDEIYKSLGVALGKDRPTDTTVLREWLEHERGRVDKMLGLSSTWELGPPLE